MRVLKWDALQSISRKYVKQDDSIIVHTVVMKYQNMITDIKDQDIFPSALPKKSPAKLDLGEQISKTIVFKRVAS